MDSLQKSKDSMEQCHSRRKKQIYRQFLHEASKGLSFSQDVMWEMGADGISYSMADFSWLFQFSKPLAPCYRSESKKKAGKKILQSYIDLRSQETVGDLMEFPPPALPPLETTHCKPLTTKEPFKITAHKGEEGGSCKKMTCFIKASKDCRDGQVEINRPAKAMTFKQTKPPKPPCLLDSLNPHIGKQVYHTENDFEQELYSGMGGREKGARRWTHLPSKADYTLEMGLRPPYYSGQKTRVSQKQVHYNTMPELSLIRYAVEEWRNAWKINIPWKTVTTDDLKKALTDMHYHVRVAAIAICALRAVNRSKKELGGIKTAQNGQEFDEKLVTTELQPLLLSSLNDPVKRVQMAAAVCQYAMGTPTASAREILHNTLHQDCSGTGEDSWVAAQCLAIEDEASRPVIERVLTMLFTSKAPSDQEQAATLLASISSKTTFVRTRLAEELNCPNWRIRVLACNTISLLKCPTNKDLINKLIYLMWNDWSGLVRQAAAHALGKLNMGSDVHDELRAKLDEGPVSWRVWALVLLGQLKIMTAKLLPAFLHCMNDDFVVVRKQACLTAALLKMKDKMIMDQLIELMQNDTCCDVKVVAINALGKIGFLTPPLEEHLLWALHYEEDPQVRIAACEALKILGVKGSALQNLLQERFVLELNPQVHRCIEELMKSNGYSMEGDRSTIHMITEQVQKLCSKDIITEKVLLLEDLVELQQHQKKLQQQESQLTTSVMCVQLQEKFKRSQKP